MNVINPIGRDRLEFWRNLAAAGALQCPVCRGRLLVAAPQFECQSCAATYPVESGVPLLMRPEEVASIPGQVMKVFNIDASAKDQVEAALAPLTRYRTYAHPEFANFFARFDAREVQVQATPLPVAEAQAAIAQVVCLTQAFPPALRSDVAEFRSIRLRNGSDRVLFTDERFCLYLSYRIFTPDGTEVPCTASRSPLPVALRPGCELTVPVMVRLPDGLAGTFTVRVYFLLAGLDPPPAPEPPPQPAPVRPTPVQAFLAAWRKPEPEVVVAPPPAPVEIVHWFDAAPVVEMTVTAAAADAGFPALRHSRMNEFDVHEDVARADGFLAEVIAELRAHGVPNPRILEVGAGVHPIALRTCGEGSTVVVSDISLVMQTLASIMHADNQAVREGRAGFASFDMMHPPFQDGTFDVICICAALHHIPEPDGFLRRLAPLLSPQGRFVAVREPCVVNPFEPTYISELANGFNEQMFELAEWRGIIERGGLAVDRAVIDYDCSLKFSLRVAQPA